MNLHTSKKYINKEHSFAYVLNETLEVYKPNYRILARNCLTHVKTILLKRRIIVAYPPARRFSKFNA